MLDTWMDLFWDIKRLLSTNDRMEFGIFKFNKCFSRIWKIGERYKVDKIGERTEPWPTPISTLQKREEKSFHKYLVFLSMR